METDPNTTPLASIIIPVRNEESFIEQCLRSLVEQDYPADRLEILVLDGLSEDETIPIVRKFAENHSNIRIFKNDKQIIPAALNKGIQHSSGTVILRADAHTVYEPDYVRTCIGLLLSSGASNVGGVITPVGRDVRSKTIAVAVSSPFGVGNAYYRFANKPMWVDTVAFGCWERSTLVSLGGYDESYLANEDYELNYRLRSSGGQILLTPDAKSRYFSRCSFRGLIEQYYRYGKWKVKMLGAYPESIVFRQAVPPVFVASLLLSLCMIPLSLIPFFAVAGPYVLMNAFFSLRALRENGLRCGVLLPFTFFAIHVSWGLGFFAGIKTFGFPKFFGCLKARKPVRNSFPLCQPNGYGEANK
ncbi:MAG: glycosyltransferase family 2 protein [Desulfobacteraceae bacterium]|nr:glycosyltransferase family 2 protein [Desulfobacteraceae bacterium]